MVIRVLYPIFRQWLRLKHAARPVEATE
jgi:hypothetical protein